MRNNLAKFLFGRGSGIETAFIALALTFIALACTCGGKSTPPPAGYVGQWKSNDGAVLNISADGTGKYISASGNEKFEGVAIEVDETAKELKIKLLGVEVKKMKIEQAAAGGQMKLDGMTFKNSSGSTSSDPKTSDTKTSSDDKKSPFGDTMSNKTETTSKTDSTASGDVPGESEIRNISVDSLRSFNDAVLKGNFDDFYETISPTWQKQITPEKFEEIFADAVTKKTDITPKTGENMNFSPKPFINSDKLLEVTGNYQSAKSGKVNFKLKYMKEGSDWKLFGIRFE